MRMIEAATMKKLPHPTTTATIFNALRVCIEASANIIISESISLDF